MLGALAGFTIVTDDLDGAAHAYATFLSYRGDAVARVSPDQAARWRAPSLAGSRQAVLRPASRHPRFIRLIEHRQAASYRPLRSLGWNAIEIVVQSLDDVAHGLEGSPFRVLGAPEVLDLGFTDKIRAMQVAGPAGEVLYLTEIGGEIPGFALPVARSPVDCAFVAVLGAASLERSAKFYATASGSPAGPALAARIACLSDAHGMPAETRHALATVSLPSASLIEIDAYPATATARPLTPCGVPAGIGFVSFASTAVSPARLLTGPDSEWIEILSTEDPLLC
jgi:hypothetical protein